MPARIAIPAAAAIAVAICDTMVRTCPITSRTSTTEVEGKPADSARTTARSRPGGIVIVAARLCGTSDSALGLNTITKLNPIVSHSISRNEAMRAVRSCPATLMVSGSPSLRFSASPMRSSTETSGGPA